MTAVAIVLVLLYVRHGAKAAREHGLGYWSSPLAESTKIEGGEARGFTS
jgi:hypothetical protein